VEHEEVHLDVLEVLKDEDKDYDQRHDAYDEGRPGSAESRLTLAWKRTRGFWIGLALGVRHQLRFSHPRLQAGKRQARDRRECHEARGPDGYVSGAAQVSRSALVPDRTHAQLKAGVTFAMMSN
jgi:hypothetical protein